MGIFRSIIYICIISVIISTVAHIWISNKSYQFIVGDVKTIGKANSGFYFSPIELTKAIKHRYSDLILNDNSVPWISLSTGKLNGKVKLLYSSLSELLAIYHTPFDSHGSSGRQFINVSVTVLKGSVSISREDNLTPIQYIEVGVVGDSKESTTSVWNRSVSEWLCHLTNTHYKSVGIDYWPCVNVTCQTYVHYSGTVTEAKFKSDTYLLVYGRGFIPYSIFYWIFDSIFSTFDFIGAFLIIFYYIKALLYSLAIVDILQYCFNESWKISSNGLDEICKIAKIGIENLPELYQSCVGWILNILSTTF